MDPLDIGLRAVVVLKGLTEILLLTMIGQAALFLLAGSRRHGNLIYGAFNQICARVFRLFRYVTPRFLPDRHLPFVAFFGLLLLELVLIIAKISLVAETMLRAQR
jgi:uncharacterized protein YggT (Ycf19 family)